MARRWLKFPGLQVPTAELLIEVLDGPPQPREFPILAELRAEGVTEYLGLPLPFSDGSWKAITFSTCAPGGFSDEQFAMLPC